MKSTTVSQDEKNSNPVDTTNYCAQITSPGRIEYVNTAVPETGPTEILIRMEGWGIVVAKGNNVERFKVGDRVAALSFHAFALFEKVDQSSAVLIPEELDKHPFPGEALGCAMNVWERSKIKPGQRVAIIGAGFLGGLLCQLASRSGVSVIAISRRRFALKAAEKCGARHTCLLGELSEVIESVNKAFGSECDCVIEATGFQYPLTVAGALVKNGGRLIIAGYHQDGMRQIDMQQWNWKGIDVINAHER